jgi:hypothetical protein
MEEHNMVSKKRLGLVFVGALLLALCLWHRWTSSATAQDLLDDIQQRSQVSDFCPQVTADGWTYFYVPDERSVYRLQQGSSAPEFVCGDCDGNVQISAGQLSFFRKGNSALRGQWITADLDGSHQKVRSSSLISTSDTWNRTVVGDFLVIEGDHRTTFVPLTGGQSSGEPLTISGEQVVTLLWTDGNVLYYSTQRGDADSWDNDSNIHIWRYDFQNAPEQVDIPDTYRYSNHIGNQVFFSQLGQSSVYALTLPEETWALLGTGNTPVYPLGSGDYLFISADELKTFDASQLMGDRTILRKSGSTYCGLVEMEDGLLVCYDLEYHSNYEHCGCNGATYIHHYIRTSLVDPATGTILWTSDGNDFILDT